MISIQLHNLGKKFNREWIFRQVNLNIAPGQKTAILGGNGSGKSTFIQVISGAVTATEGSVIYKNREADLDPDMVRNHISFASPYLQLIEDFTLPELIDHVRIFKPFVGELSTSQIIERLQLPHAAQKPIRHFSSGMKQRVRLGLALMAATEIVFLDEPHSNLDKNAIEWYRGMISEFAKERTVIVCSNSISDEYYFCEQSLEVSSFKPVAR